MKKLLLLTMSMMLAATSVFGLYACTKEDPEKLFILKLKTRVLASIGSNL